MQCIFSNKPSSRNARASQTADRRRMSSTAGTAPAVRDSPTPERSLHTPQAQSAAPERTVSCSSASPSQESCLPIQSFSTTNPYADFARRQWHCRRVQQFIRSVLGALPNSIGWLVAERQQHPTTSQGVSSQFGATGAKSCMMASAVSRRETGVANVLAGLKVQTKAGTTLF